MPEARRGEFSGDFEKSRTRLIYFTAFGLLSLLFPVDPTSSLFGLKLQNLSSDRVTMLFAVIVLIMLLFDFLLKAIEEFPVLNRKEPSALARAKLAFEEFDECRTNLEGIEKRQKENLDALVRWLNGQDEKWRSATVGIENEQIMALADDIVKTRENVMENFDEMKSAADHIMPRIQRLDMENQGFLWASFARAHFEYWPAPIVACIFVGNTILQYCE